MLQLFRVFAVLHRLTPRIQRWVLYLILGFGISLLLTRQVYASETVVLQYYDRRQPIPLAELQAFAADQSMAPDLQQFLQDTHQDPVQVREWLTSEINAVQLPEQISSDFVLLQINKILGDPLGREDLDPLRAAFQKTLKDDRAFSVLEILENYPKSEMRLELGQLGQVYSDVNLLVTRIEPVLLVANELLPELICDCQIASPTVAPTVAPKSAPTTDQTMAPAMGVTDLASAKPTTAIAYRQTREAVKSLLPVVEQTAEESPAVAPLVALESSTAPGLANKRLVIQFGPLGRSISLKDLTYFAETGELSRGWRFFFNVAGIDPEAVRVALNQEVAVNLKFLDQTLNNLLGEFLLYQVGQVVHTQSNTANIQALRSAAVLSVVPDNRLSLLEVLQQYPTPQVYINGVQLARLGRNAARFQASGGVRAAVLSLEDWLLQLQASTAKNLCSCDSGAESDSNALFPQPIAPTIAPQQVAQFLPANWQPVAPHREDRGKIKVVWLQGSDYEMGYQHGQYLHDEIASLGSEVLSALRFAGKGLALGRLAERRSYPEIVEECRGLADATQDIGMTLSACLVLAYGDVYQEIFANTLPDVLFWNGCSQWVATGDATVDGRLYHGSTLDNDNKPIDYIVDNPVVFIRQPNDGLPHVFITYPGVVWPNWGLNVAGITLGLDSLHPRGPEELSLRGVSDVQIMGQVLKAATNFAEARQIMESELRSRANLIMVTDGKSKEAGVFEVIGKNIGMRELQPNGVLYTTNHSVLESMYDRQQFPLSESSLVRFKRFGQLMEPGGVSSHYGQIDPAVMAKIGRDRVNPNTMQASPLNVFDDDASPGGNGSLRQGLYDPDHLLLWVAGGRPPVPENPFVCFSLGEMLNFPNATPCPSPAL